jgi:hypothetical protein
VRDLERQEDKQEATQDAVPPTVPPTMRKASFGATIKTVLWSFFGIRKRSDHDKETAQLNPVHIVIAALMIVAVFVMTLILIVKSVVGK